MKSRRTKRFHECFAQLPSDIQSQARQAYQLFQGNPGHPGLRFKRVHRTEPIYAVRVSQDYRAVGVRRSSGFGSAPTPPTTGSCHDSKQASS